MDENRLKILLIEDNSGDVVLIHEQLRDVTLDRPGNFSFSLDFAECLMEGVRKLKGRAYDIVLLDLTLPDSTGIETVNRMLNACPHVPVIVLSGMEDEALALQAIQNGAQDYLVKNETTGPLMARAIQYAIERKNEEAALKASNYRLLELDKLKNNFFSMATDALSDSLQRTHQGIAHCLDNMSESAREKEKEQLKDTLKNITHFSQMVTDLRDIVKIESGQLQINCEDTDLSLLIAKLFNFFQPLTEEKGVTLNYQLPDHNIKIYADPDKVKQIFETILKYALHFTPRGGGISFGATDHKDFIQCFVKDCSTGLPAEDLSGLFSKYEQLKRQPDHRNQGMGAGLFIAKGLVEKHGGKIWAEPNAEKGVVYQFTLHRRPHPKILIVDDEKHVINVIREFLYKDGYQFFEAFDGRSAIRLATHEQPELILLDMHLPGMNGYEVVGRLKHDVRTEHIPLIIMSAFDIDKDRLINPNGHSKFPVIQKPFDHMLLREKVRELLVN